MPGKNGNTAKLITILDYVSFFCLIGLFAERDDEDVRFHTNQGLLLAILEVCGGVIFGVLQLLPYIGGAIHIIAAVFGLLCLGLFRLSARWLPVIILRAAIIIKTRIIIFTHEKSLLCSAARRLGAAGR